MSKWDPPKSNFRGVSFSRVDMKWKASSAYKGKSVHIGRFVNEEDAARAYDRWSWKMYREKKRLNFPEEVTDEEIAEK